MDKHNSSIMVVTSGSDLASQDFLPAYLNLLLGAFPGEISVIISRVPPLSNGESFPKRVHIKQVMLEIGEKRGGAGNRVIRYLLTQLEIAYVLARQDKADAYIFFLAQTLLLPILILKLMRRKVILAVGASFSKLGESRKDRLLWFPKIEEKISFQVSDHIVIYSEEILEQFNLEKHKGKISIARRHFLDFDQFKRQKPLSERDNLVGYIGRLSREKGILNFIEAVPRVLEKEVGLEVLIGGDGPLRRRVEQYLGEHKINNRVKFVGWIPHDRLPEYLNELKLVVIPSYTETGPLLMVEAMACGTPVLITPVGSAPTVIRDGETGFIMADNSPDCIAKNIIRALNYPHLEEIAKNAGALVVNEYSYESAVEGYKTILSDLLSGR